MFAPFTRHRIALAAAASTLILTTAAHADFSGVIAPSTRGDAGTGYVELDSFVAGIAPTGAVGSMITADSGGGLTADATQTSFADSPGGILGPPAPADNLFYHHFYAGDWTLSFGNPLDVNYVLLQIKEDDGPGLNPTIVLIDGAAPTTTTPYSDGDGDAIIAYYWELGSTITGGTGFDIGITVPGGSFTAFDSFSIDVSNVAIPPVPEPSSIVTAALVSGGLLLVRRRRKQDTA